MSEVLCKVVKNYLGLMKGSYLLVYVSCGYRDGEAVDLRDSIDESSYITQVFLGGFSQFSCVRIEDENTGTEVLVADLLAAQNGVVLGISTAKSDLCRCGLDGIIYKSRGESYSVYFVIDFTAGSF